MGERDIRLMRGQQETITQLRHENEKLRFEIRNSAIVLTGEVKNRILDLKSLLIKSEFVVDWMTEQAKWRENETLQNISPESKGHYSEKLTDALDFLEQLKKENHGQAAEVPE